MPDISESLTARAAALAGALPGLVLGGTLGVTARLRRTKPLHPVGRVADGVLDVTNPQSDLGVPLLESVATHPCLVRYSRAVGLPAPLPDVEGLALRFTDPTADLLFAATGTGRLSRFLLVPRGAEQHGPQTTLLPVSSARGPLMFQALPVAGTGEPPRRFEIAVASPASQWRQVATLTIGPWGEDRPTRFDPVRNLLPGTEQYAVVRTLREPAYLLARRNATARS